MFEANPHPHRAARAKGPTTTHKARREGKGRLGRLGALVGSRITNLVGTMTCAFLFACLAFTSLPAVLKLHNQQALVAWIAQTFLQLVLLSVIIVGQNVQAAAADGRAVDTFADAEAILHELDEVHRHLDVLLGEK